MMNFGIDTTVRMRIDGKITAFPNLPLCDVDKAHLLASKIDLFVNHFKKKLIQFKLLEGHEKANLMDNKPFYSASFIFMKRCLEMFDKSKYEEPTFTTIPNFSIPELTPVEKAFAKGVMQLSLDDIESLGDSEKIALRCEIAKSRLEHMWEVYALKQIVFLMKETVKTQVDKGIPKKSSFKNGLGKKSTPKAQEKKTDEYIQTLRSIKNSSWDEDINIDERDVSAEIGTPISELITVGDKLFKKYIFCANHLELSGRELTDEFGADTLKQLKQYEKQLQGKK